MSTSNQSSIPIPSPSPEETPEKERTSHDLIWKQTFTLFLADLLELLDPEIGALLDVEEAEFIDKEAFSDFPKGERSEADLVARARTREHEPRIILCHFEVEGEFREQIDERISRYFIHLKGKYNLPVLSVVVFLTGGTAGVEQREVVETIGPVEVYRFRYLAFGLSQSLAEEYVDRPQALAAGLAALMRSKRWDKVEQKLRCLRAIHRGKLNSLQQHVLGDIVETYIRLNPEDERRFAVEISREANKEIQDMQMSWAQELKAEGRTEGRAEGRTEGRAEGRSQGRADGTRDAIVLLWEHRFGPMPDAVRKRLEAISDLERLHEILEQLLAARSVDDLNV